MIVGAPGSLSSDTGSLVIVFFAAAGTAVSSERVSQLAVSNGPPLFPGGYFGFATSAMRSRDPKPPPGSPPMTGAPSPKQAMVAVGEPGRFSASSATGSVWLVTLADTGTALAALLLAPGHGGIPRGIVPDGSRFGHAIASLPDVSGDSVGDLAVSAPLFSTPDLSSTGVVFLLELTSDSGVGGIRRLDSTGPSNFKTYAVTRAMLGAGLANLGDIDNDGQTDLAVGHLSYSSDAGAVLLLLGITSFPGQVLGQYRMNPGDTMLPVPEQDLMLGSCMTDMGDVDGDGTGDILVGAKGF